MAVEGKTHRVICDQCGRIGPTVESLVHDLQGWNSFDRIKEEHRVIDLCPKCKSEWRAKDP